MPSHPWQMPASLPQGRGQVFEMEKRHRDLPPAASRRLLWWGGIDTHAVQSTHVVLSLPSHHGTSAFVSYVSSNFHRCLPTSFATWNGLSSRPVCTACLFEAVPSSPASDDNTPQPLRIDRRNRSIARFLQSCHCISPPSQQQIRSFI